jgi:hypothetical protein
MPLALAGLLLAAVPAPAADPQDRGLAPRISAAAAARASAAAPMRGRVVVSRDRRAATAAAACPRDGRGGGARCRSRAVGWMDGLSPAAGVQAAECPAGTMATLATGYADVVRCVPI